MNVTQFLKQVAHIVPSDIPEDDGKAWVSNFDNSYVTRVGMEDDGLLRFLAEHEVISELTNGVGYSPKEDKWYGWSHRAIYGFEIGSTCKRGDCHYRASCVEEEIAAAILFWQSDDYCGMTAKEVFNEESNEHLIEVTWTYGPNVKNRSLIGKTGGARWHYDPNSFGKGEWTATSLEEARQMAEDFREGVS